MPTGYSLHIGLNRVDPNAYNGWDGRLAGCLNDANAMRRICTAQGFVPQSLLDEDANAAAITGAIGQAAFNLQTGDTFVISYSGHGGEVPDETGDSETGLDQTWVAFDRMIVDHELYNLWGQFEPGVRIEVYSDSCHSGTVIRELFMQNGMLRLAAANSPAPAWKKGVRGMRNMKSVFGQAAQTSIVREVASLTLGKRARFIPPRIAMDVYKRDQPMYSALQWSRKRTDISATVILISGCQDNQVSADGDTNGLFTEKLLNVWNNGKFTGNLTQFHKAILALMPSDQTPNFLEVGRDDSVFSVARPLTVVEGMSNAGEPVDEIPDVPEPAETRAPVVTGPGTYDRSSDQPPTFTVNPGSNTYYIFEIASDPALFGKVADRTTGNFYGSWADPESDARYSTATYRLPIQAWEDLKSNDRLYYRVGSTSSQTDWADYMVSTSDGDAATSAPAMAIDDAQAVRPQASRDAEMALRYQ